MGRVTAGTLHQTPKVFSAKPSGDRKGWHMPTCTKTPFTVLFITSSSLPVARPRAGVKNSRAALRPTQCADHLSLVRHAHVHGGRLRYKNNFIRTACNTFFSKAV